LHAGCRPGLNHACQFLWRSVKGFWCGEGSNFCLFYWLASSPLKHSCTTVWVCDYVLYITELVTYCLMVMCTHLLSLSNTQQKHLSIFCFLFLHRKYHSMKIPFMKTADLAYHVGGKHENISAFVKALWCCQIANPLSQTQTQIVHNSPSLISFHTELYIYRKTLRQ